jgi:hypothetical protein
LISGILLFLLAKYYSIFDFYLKTPNRPGQGGSIGEDFGSSSKIHRFYAAQDFK